MFSILRVENVQGWQTSRKVKMQILRAKWFAWYLNTKSKSNILETGVMINIDIISDSHF